MPPEPAAPTYYRYRPLLSESCENTRPVRELTLGRLRLALLRALLARQSVQTCNNAASIGSGQSTAPQKHRASFTFAAVVFLIAADNGGVNFRQVRAPSSEPPCGALNTCCSPSAFLRSTRPDSFSSESAMSRAQTASRSSSVKFQTRREDVVELMLLKRTSTHHAELNNPTRQHNVVRCACDPFCRRLLSLILQQQVKD